MPYWMIDDKTFAEMVWENKFRHARRPIIRSKDLMFSEFCELPAAERKRLLEERQRYLGMTAG